MKTIESDLLLSSLAEALETMAFVGIDPAEDSPASADLLQISLAFSGPIRGQLTLCAPASLGTTIAANLSAVEPDAVTPAHAIDALRELANVTAGLLLRQVCTPEEMPQLSIPIVTTTPAVVGTHSCCLASLSADGHPVTIGVRTNS